MDFGSYLKRTRKERKISQRKLAGLVGYSNAEISRIESGSRKKISPDIIKKLASVLGVPYVEMMDKAGFGLGSLIEGEGNGQGKDSLSEDKEITKLIKSRLEDKGWGISVINENMDFILAEKDGTKWLVDIVVIKDMNNETKETGWESGTVKLLESAYGRMVMCGRDDVDKYSFVVDSPDLISTIATFKPSLVKVPVGLIYADVQKNVIVEVGVY